MNYLKSIFIINNSWFYDRTQIIENCLKKKNFFFFFNALMYCGGTRFFG